ncbi:hypothetical protein Fcan01_26771 [Folsomia candida]|uniref:Uncharacterized protein n=1 Tax=Folsomia candida TaxID=158441 RepID=A0A226CYT1_FOLCA|nr:hypothetical protein Fcan01_26771 [Folsomia candida]
MESSPPTTACSETRGELRRYKGIRSSKKSLHSCSSDFYMRRGADADEDAEDEADTLVLGPRSLSLSALVPKEVVKKSPHSSYSALLTPDPNRMSQLETLEAKMASIEVSLASVAAAACAAASSAAPIPGTSTSCSSLHHVSGSSGGGGSGPPRRTKRSLLGSARSQLASSSSRTDLLLLHKEVENLKTNLKDKDNLILNLQTQLRKLSKRRGTHGSITSTDSGILSLRVLSESERKAAEERLAALDRDMEQKRGDIHSINQRLGRLRPSDNIDTRIEQAELEYELEREELNLMNLAEERRNLHTILDDNDTAQKRGENSLFTSLPLNGTVSLHSFEIVLDAGSGADTSGFTVGKREDRAGTYINGTCVISKGVNRLEEFWLDEDNNLSDDVELTAHPLRVVVMRAPPPPPPPRGPNRELHTVREELSLVTAKLEQVVKEKREAVALWNQLQGEVEPLLRLRTDTEHVTKERDALRTEGVRLKHRISYLEEQVSEMIQEKVGSSAVTVFQKGSTRTTIVGGSDRPPSVTSNSTSKSHPKDTNGDHHHHSTPSTTTTTANNHRMIGSALRSRLWETFRRATTSTDSRSVCSIDSSKAGTEAGYFSKKRHGGKNKSSSSAPSKPLRLSLQRATSSSEVYMAEPHNNHHNHNHNNHHGVDLHPNNNGAPLLRRSNDHQSENALLAACSEDRGGKKSKARGKGSSGGGIRWPSLRPASSMSYAMPSASSNGQHNNLPHY